MKRYNYICTLLLLLQCQQSTRAMLPNEPVNIEEKIATYYHECTLSERKYIGTTLAFGCITTIMGIALGYYLKDGNRTKLNCLKLKAEQLKKSAQEKAKQEEQRSSHLLNNIKALVSHFAPIKKISHSHPEKNNELQQKQFLQKLLIMDGSVSAFEQTINKHIDDYKTLDIASAEQHRELYIQLEWIKHSLYSNKYASDLKKIEEEQRFTKAEREAKLKKMESETRAAQEITRITEQQSVINRRLHELNAREAIRAREHQESITQLKELNKKCIELEQLIKINHITQQ